MTIEQIASDIAFDYCGGGLLSEGQARLLKARIIAEFSGLIEKRTK